MLVFSFIAMLVLCFYQDVRFRGIHWVLFPLLFINSGLISGSLFSWTTLYNLTFVFACLVMLTLYVSAKMKSLTNITDGYFSWGDILFLIAMAPMFDFYTFVFFFTFGTCVTLIIHLVVSLLKRQKTVPYAGYMAVVAIAFLFWADPFKYFLIP